MTNIRDWCISRQLWWGHRIPVWYCENDRHCPRARSRSSAASTPDRCPHCGSTNLRQDEDVLDTWFSSWLWPFSVHDWPAAGTARQRRRPPVLLSHRHARHRPRHHLLLGRAHDHGGPEIRAVVHGKHATCEDNIPFRDVYFTSLVRDDKGRKMSKSLGNSPEPLDLIAEYGADAVRFTILYLAPLGQDILYSREKNEIGRNFANKIWNAGRFLLMNRDQIGESPKQGEFNLDSLDLADRWILSRLHSTLVELNAALEEYEINKISKTIYDFLWHDFCDWYLEMIKSRLYGDEPHRREAGGGQPGDRRL